MTNFYKFTHARGHHAHGLSAVAELRRMGRFDVARDVLVIVRNHRIGMAHLFAPIGG